MIGLVKDILGLSSPDWIQRRMSGRATMAQVSAFGGGLGGYEAGKTNRLNRTFLKPNINENAVPVGQLRSIRARSWDLYRNNPHARKIVRNLESKVIGNGLTPQSRAVLADGSANVEFRKACQDLWHRIQCELDARGRPGKGGLSGVDLQRLALRSVILGGDSLYQAKSINRRRQREWGLRIPLVLQLISAERLDENLTTTGQGDNRIYRGVEVNDEGRRVAYHLLDAHPSDPLQPTGGYSSRRYAAEDVGHLFVAEDEEQLRGVPWFAPVVMKMRDAGDYEYNELVGSAMAACTVVAITRPMGNAQVGLNQPAEWDVTDSEGNPLTALQPGMIVNKGRDGDIELLTPPPRAANAEQWSTHLHRGIATGVPGVKSSTITGDYRNSSFSSEKSADNDVWPELEAIQQWFAMGFCQPVYEAVVDAAVLSGYFGGLDVGDYSDRRSDYLDSSWQGPVARSINPVDDANAARIRVKSGNSTPQIEAAREGRNWRDNLDQFKEFFEYADEIELDENVTMNIAGIEQTDQPAQGNGQQNQQANGQQNGQGNEQSQQEALQEAA